jgi:protein-disulfide isomerase
MIETKNKPKKNNLAPLIIIGLVFIVAIGAFAWFYKLSTAPKVNKNTNQATNKSTNETPRVTNAPAGAQPPHMLGSPTSPVTIEEFADFQCPQCARTFPLTKEIIGSYGQRIKFIFRNYPLNIPQHDKAYSAAVAAEAAGLQGKFWDMQNQLFTNQNSWTAATDFNKFLEEYAQKIGLDVEKFKNDMAGLAAKQRVDADIARGRALGVGSTPSFYLNGQLIPFEQIESTALRQLIDAELAKTQPANQTAPASNTNTTNK